MPQEGWDLIDADDCPFKSALNQTKYASRYQDVDAKTECSKAADFLMSLDNRLQGQTSLFGHRATIADLAILAFSRQFANTDRKRFDAQPWPDLIALVNTFTQSEAFAHVTTKYARWSKSKHPLWFGG